jgi:heterotetrameric sarcosine oxidase gamma subunit
MSQATNSRPPAGPLCRTPLHHWHAARATRFTDSPEWRLPLVYSTVEREVAAARSGVALADLSAFAKISLLGGGVPALAQALAPESPATKPRSVAVLEPHGPVLACRLTDDHLLLLDATTAATALQERLARLPALPQVVQVDASATYAGFLLAGPRLEEMLPRLTALDVAALLPVGACAETAFAGVHALLVRAPEMSVPCVRVYVGWDLAEFAWERLLEEGRRHGLAPLGLEALNALVAAP